MSTCGSQLLMEPRRSAETDGRIATRWDEASMIRIILR